MVQFRRERGGFEHPLADLGTGLGQGVDILDVERVEGWR